MFINSTNCILSLVVKFYSNNLKFIWGLCLSSNDQQSVHSGLVNPKISNRSSIWKIFTPGNAPPISPPASCSFSSNTTGSAPHINFRLGMNCTLKKGSELWVWAQVWENLYTQMVKKRVLLKRHIWRGRRSKMADLSLFRLPQQAHPGSISSRWLSPWSLTIN